MAGWTYVYAKPSANLNLLFKITTLLVLQNASALVLRPTKRFIVCRGEVTLYANELDVSCVDNNSVNRPVTCVEGLKEYTNNQVILS